MSKSRHPAILMFLLAIPLLVLLSACTSYNQALLKHRHQSVTRNIPAFNPAWFKDTEHQHAALFFDIEDGHMRVQSIPAQLRPGSLPYQTREGGQIVIIYYDNEQREIGRYSSEDPMLARSCTSRRRGVQPLQQAMVEILVPADRNIATLVLSQGDLESARYHITRQMQAME